MVYGCLGKFTAFKVRFIRETLVIMYASLTRLAFVDHEDNYTACRICSINPRACPLVRQDIQKLLDQRTIMITYYRNLYDDEFNVIIPRFNVLKLVEIIYDNRRTSAYSFGY